MDATPTGTKIKADLLFNLLLKVRRERQVRGIPPSTAGLPPITRLYTRFLREGPRRGDGCFSKDTKEKTAAGFQIMLPETIQHQKVVRAFDIQNLPHHHRDRKKVVRVRIQP